jgi:hypothetical protein
MAVAAAPVFREGLVPLLMAAVAAAEQWGRGHQRWHFLKLFLEAPGMHNNLT